jgi:hypothetical protein
MASEYSPSLKLTLIGDGDQAGIWGQTTNTNLGTLLEQAITGVQSITMVDANYTLTNFNGVTNEARNAVLVVTGTNNAIRDLIPPVVEKLYTIVNNTTGGFAIRVIGGSGTGVNIPNGATCLVYCDGTNFVNGLSGAAGNFSISGALSTTGALTYGGVTLANAVTGTGNMVLSASPTLTGTPLSTTAANGTSTTQIATTAFVNAAVTISNAALGTMSTQNANAVAITGGTINGVAITTSTIPNSNVTGLGSLATQNSVTGAQLPTGATVQTQYAQFTTTTTGGSAFSDTGITVNITPASASNQVLVRVCYSWSATDNTATLWRLVRNGTVVGAGSSGASVAIGQPSFVRDGIFSAALEFLDSPSSTSALTYKLQGSAPNGGNVWTINQNQTGAGTLAGYTSTSSITVQEIKG